MLIYCDASLKAVIGSEAKPGYGRHSTTHLTYLEFFYKKDDIMVHAVLTFKFNGFSYSSIGNVSYFDGTWVVGMRSKR